MDGRADEGAQVVRLDCPGFDHPPDGKSPGHFTLVLSVPRHRGSALSGVWADACGFFGLAWILLFLSVVLPDSAREKLIGWVQGFERKTGLTALLLIAFTAYGLTRMVKVCFSEAGVEIPKVFQRASEPKTQNKTTL